MSPEEQEKIEHDFKRASSGDPLYKPRTHGLSANWVCSCGARITIDSHLIGNGVSSYSAWCRSCDKAMDRDDQPTTVPILELAAKYGFTGEDKNERTTGRDKKKVPRRPDSPEGGEH